MLKLLLFLTCLSISTSYHVSKMSAEIAVLDAELPRNEPLHLQGVKKINKALVEHVIMRNCSGVIDEATFKHFPKLSKITLQRSNIKEINTILPITHLIALGSHIPNLDFDLQQKLPKLRAVMLLGNKNFEVNSKVLKNFKHLQALYISEANFTENCITKEWFKGMDSLYDLGLSDNGLDCVTEDAFNSLKTLEKLDLTFNHFPNLDKKIFKNLTKLEILGLYENDIDHLDIGSLASQKNHLEQLGIEWNVLKESKISAEDFLKAFPKLKSLSFGHKDMPNDFEAGMFCQTLRQKGVTCDVDFVFGVAKTLGYSMLGSEPS